MDRRKVISVVVLLLLSIFVYKLNINKVNNKKVEKIKQSTKVNRKQFAMYIKDKGDYKEYISSDTFPEGYVIDESMSKCYDVDEQEIEGVTFTGNGNSITVTSGKTAYCYIYLNKFFKGDGTVNNPYQIYTIEDLVDLSDYANTGDERIQEKNFKLMRNLDFKDPGSYEDSNRKDYGNINGDTTTEELIKELASGTGFTPIGVGSYNGVTNRFNSNFDGGGYKISNLYVNVLASTHAAFFGVVGKAGSTNTIKNLTLTGSITKKLSRNYIGGFIASSSATTLNLENLHNETTITVDEDGYTGGIVGYVNESANITNCSNKGNITSKDSVGGIIGYSGGNGSGNININSTTNYGKISGNNCLGGIICRKGGAGNINIKNTHNYGEILLNELESSNDVGGILGIVGSNGNTFINVCSNHGTILTSNEDATSSGNIYMGGLIGHSDDGIILNSGNYGNIEVNYPNVTVSKHYYLGGLIGYSNYSNVLLLNNFNTGNIKSFISTDDSSLNDSIQLGGIIGYSSPTSYSPNMNNIYNSGDITTLGYGSKYAIGRDVNSSSANVYYKNTTGLLPALSGYSVPEAIEEANMKIGDANNTTGLLYKLNNNVKTLNTNGLTSIDSNLSGYTLDEWVIDSITGYPTLKGLLNK